MHAKAKAYEKSATYDAIALLPGILREFKENGCGKNTQVDLIPSEVLKLDFSKNIPCSLLVFSQIRDRYRFLFMEITNFVMLFVAKGCIS